MRLVIEDGAQCWIQDVPDEGPIGVGRALTNTVIIEDTAASREHCRVSRDPSDGRYWVEDLGSRNGTRLNGRFVTKALLQAGDRIEIGSTVITFPGPGDAGARQAEALQQELRARAAVGEEVLARDPLTELASFPAAVAELKRLQREAGERDERVTAAVLKLDLDYLGLMNDMFGLRAGDELIRKAAGAIRSAMQAVPGVRPLVAREAGGKFLVIAPRCSREQARELGELARAEVARLDLQGPLRAASITLSGGVAQAPDDGEEWESLLRRAEAALSHAKQTGRDRLASTSAIGAEEQPRLTSLALRETRASGLWAASGLWDPRVAKGAGAPDEESNAAIAPLTLSHGGQSILGLVAQALGSDLELDALLDLILTVVVDTTGARRGFVLLRGGIEGSALRVRAVVNRDAPGARWREGSVSQGIVRQVEKARSAVLVSDARTDERFKERESIIAEGARSIVAAPILWGETVVGVIYLDNRSVAGGFGDEARDLLLACARLIAGPIRRQVIHQARAEELERAKLALSRTAESEILTRRRYTNIVGESAAMKKLFRLLDRLADSAHPVLIHGESGTGKELVASAIHYNGTRAKGPFIAENCAALSDSLLEAELFGHVKGSYTGADSDRVGLIEAAHGGTLFLDEIGEMSERMQAKLLRVLQEGELRPVGGREVRKVDFRLIAASNRDLAAMARQGTFREDLYYRIAVMTLDVPPLRERRDDIPLLVDALLARAAAAEKRRPPEVSRDALQLLVHYDWPGNVRELENELKKLLTLVPDCVLPEHLSPKILGGELGEVGPSSAIRKVAVTDGVDAMLLMLERGKGLAEVVEAFEQELISRVLVATDGNRSETARRLGLSRPGLLKKMKRFGID